MTFKKGDRVEVRSFIGTVIGEPTDHFLLVKPEDGRFSVNVHDSHCKLLPPEPKPGDMWRTSKGRVGMITNNFGELIIHYVDVGWDYVGAAGLRERLFTLDAE